MLLVSIEKGNVVSTRIVKLWITTTSVLNDDDQKAIQNLYNSLKGKTSNAKKLALAVLMADDNDLGPIGCLYDELQEMWTKKSEGAKYVPRERMIEQLVFCFRVLASTVEHNGTAPGNVTKVLGFTERLLHDLGYETKTLIQREMEEGKLGPYSWSEVMSAR
jgi:hypothetical protein